MKTVEEALRLEDFPMTKGDIDYSVGDIEVEDGSGGYIPVRKLTERIRRTRFDSPAEIMHALEAAKDALKRKAA